MKKKIKIALIGCGKILNKHLAAINANYKLFDLRCICEKNYLKAKKISNKLNVNFYTSIDTMMKNEKLDMVCILTANGYHYKHYLKVSNYKVDCIIEKPLTLKSDEAKKICELSFKNNTNVFVVKQNRLNQAILSFQKLRKKNYFGEIFLGNATIRWRREQKYFNQANWRGTRKLDGGVVGNQASHHLDLLIYTMGYVKEVHAYGSNNLAKKIESEDTIIANLKFKNNKIATIEATTATTPEDIEGSVSFFGSNGSIIIGGFSMNEIKYCKSNKNKKINIKSANLKNKFAQSHIDFYKYVSKNINKKKIVKQNLLLAAHVSSVIEAINNSIKYKKIVKLPIK